MSGKLAWMKFYPGDWVQDTACLSLPARGAWITLVCAMWRAETRGVLSMSIAGFSRLLGTPETETQAAINELVSASVCENRVTGLLQGVTVCPEKVTIACRRMVREEKARETNALRQSRYRANKVCNAPVTPQNQEPRTKNQEPREDIGGVPPALPSEIPPSKRVNWDQVSGKFSGFTPEDLGRLKEAYPACDIVAEILRAAEWLQANPGKRKKNNYRFIVNWMSRKQERGGGLRSNAPQPQHRETRKAAEYEQSIAPHTLT